MLGGAATLPSLAREAARAPLVEEKKYDHRFKHQTSGLSPVVTPSNALSCSPTPRRETTSQRWLPEFAVVRSLRIAGRRCRVVLLLLSAGVHSLPCFEARPAVPRAPTPTRPRPGSIDDAARPMARAEQAARRARSDSCSYLGTPAVAADRLF